MGQGYVFIGVCHSVNRGCLPQYMLGYHIPRSRHPSLKQTPTLPPRSRHPPEQTPLRSRYPQGRHLPGSRHPLGAHPLGADPPGADTPQEQTPQSRHPWEQTPPGSRHPPGADTPLCRACWEIQSMHRWYASYWNAILLPLWSMDDQVEAEPKTVLVKYYQSWHCQEASTYLSLIIKTDMPINVYAWFCLSTAKSKFSLVSPVADWWKTITSSWFDLFINKWHCQRMLLRNLETLTQRS